MLGFTIPGGGSEIPLHADNMDEQYFQMNGKAVFASATIALPKAINQVLEDTGLTIDDIDIMIPLPTQYTDFTKDSRNYWVAL